MRRSEHAKMASSSVELIGGVYGIDFARPLEGVASPGAAFTAEAGSHSGFMAVPVLRGAPARARTLAVLAGLAEAHLLSPLAHGPASRPGREAGYFVICPAPPGPSLLATLRPWSETELIEHVVKRPHSSWPVCRRAGLPIGPSARTTCFRPRVGRR